MKKIQQSSADAETVALMMGGNAARIFHVEER